MIEIKTDNTSKTAEKLACGEVTTGIFLTSASSFISEACATIQFDWMVIDLEASHATKKDTLHILQSLNTESITPIVRIPYLNKHLVEFFLDQGAEGIIVPKVESKEQAKEIVNSFYYPPIGNRGINPIRSSNYFKDIDKYLKEANDKLLCIVQIESVKGVNNIKEILEVPGIDCIFIGPGDLASDLGKPGDFQTKEFIDCIKTVEYECSNHGIFAGIFAYDINSAKFYRNLGFKFISLGNDIKALLKGLTIDFKDFNEGEKNEY